MDDVFLKVHEVSKNFIGVPALKKVSFILKRAAYMLCAEKTEPESPPL